MIMMVDLSLIHSYKIGFILRKKIQLMLRNLLLSIEFLMNAASTFQADSSYIIFQVKYGVLIRLECLWYQQFQAYY